jgi:Family of unknown function (DUF5906)
MSALDPLAEEPRWVAWRNEKRGDQGKPTKVPYGPAHGGKAKADDPATWGLRAAATATATKLANGLGGGVGIELGDLGGDTFLAGADLDSCLDEDGTLSPWAQAILDVVPSYAEISPSGTGLKLFFYVASEDVRPFLDLIGVIPPQWGTRRDAPGAAGRNHGPAIEIYLSHRYFAVTDHRWPTQPDAVQMLDWSVLERIASLIPQPKSTIHTGSTGAGDNSRSAIAFRKGGALLRASHSFEQMVEALRLDPETADWVREKGMPNGMRELHRIWQKAETRTANENGEGVSVADFYAYMPMHTYIFAPTTEMWPAGSVNARIPPIRAGQEEIKASLWLDQNNAVEQMTWCPGLPMIIPDRLIAEGGWIDRPGVRCFNLYLPPTIVPGDPRQAARWLDHIKLVFPDDADHIIKWLAHRVQRPQDKINHALVLGGLQGIGKDTIVEPVKHAIGPWNFSEPSPQQIMGRFNGFLKSVIMRINEARDLGETDRFKFYDHMKAYTAAPPDVLRVDEKNLREHSVVNVCGVIITTNHKTDGIYLPADDRRNYVAWSDLTKEHFHKEYWNGIYTWYKDQGNRHVAAYLAELDLSGFDPKAPPPKTAAFWEIVHASRAPEDSEMADALDALGSPEAVTIQQLIRNTREPFNEWLADRRNARTIPYRLEECGYVAVRNPSAKDGQWVLNGKRQAIYAKSELPQRDRYSVAAGLAGRSW